MLQSLHVRNFVLIREAEISFDPGFSVLTGETGAGKSMLVDALQAVCGRRDPKGGFPGKEGRSEIWAEFDVADIKAVGEWLDEHAFENDQDSLVMRRVFEEQGRKRSRCFVNGHPATLAQLKELSSLLIDIHGQHDSLQLLDRRFQRDLLDRYAGSLEIRADLKRNHGRLLALRRRRDSINEDNVQREEEKLMLETALAELDAISFSQEKWADADGRLRRVQSRTELLEGLERVLEILDGREGVEERLADVVKIFGNMVRIDGTMKMAAQEVSQIRELASELLRGIRQRLDEVEESSDDAAALEEFISEAHRLMRRHQCISPEILEERMEQMRIRLGELFDGLDLDRLDGEIAVLEKDLEAQADKLSKARGKAARKVSGSVTRMLREMGISNGSFKVDLVKLDSISAEGWEQVRFTVSTHSGSETDDLGKVASGGELSRIGLAVMTLMSGSRQLRTLIFDEIDAGIGGETAVEVGRVMRDLAGSCGQVLCVTHLPQIASQADAHWGVSVGKRNGSPAIGLRSLEGVEREEEIARMLGGDNVGDTAKVHAAGMLRMGRRREEGRRSRH